MGFSNTIGINIGSERPFDWSSYCTPLITEEDEYFITEEGSYFCAEEDEEE